MVIPECGQNITQGNKNIASQENLTFVETNAETKYKSESYPQMLVGYRLLCSLVDETRRAVFKGNADKTKQEMTQLVDCS